MVCGDHAFPHPSTSRHTVSASRSLDSSAPTLPGASRRLSSFHAACRPIGTRTKSALGHIFLRSPKSGHTACVPGIGSRVRLAFADEEIGNHTEERGNQPSQSRSWSLRGIERSDRAYHDQSSLMDRCAWTVPAAPLRVKKAAEGNRCIMWLHRRAASHFRNYRDLPPALSATGRRHPGDRWAAARGDREGCANWPYWPQGCLR